MLGIFTDVASWPMGGIHIAGIVAASLLVRLTTPATAATVSHPIIVPVSMTANGRPCAMTFGLCGLHATTGDQGRFLCPSCRRRVAVLYLPGMLAACRKCYNICYSSQCEDFGSRAMRRMGQIEARLGDPGYNDFPPKPKRMRWHTYERLWEKYQVADYQSMAGLLKIMQRFNG